MAGTHTRKLRGGGDPLGVSGGRGVPTRGMSQPLRFSTRPQPFQPFHLAGGERPGALSPPLPTHGTLISRDPFRVGPYVHHSFFGAPMSTLASPRAHTPGPHGRSPSPSARPARRSGCATSFGGTTRSSTTDVLPFGGSVSAVHATPGPGQYAALPRTDRLLMTSRCATISALAALLR